MLICKPLPTETALAGISFNANRKMVLRNFDLVKDPGIIHRWPGIPDPANISRIAYYENLLSDPDAHCYVITLEELMVARLIVRCMEKHELAKTIATRPDDIILYILIAPALRPLKEVNTAIANLLSAYFFNFPQVERIYAAPGIDDHKTGQWLRDMGFRFVENKVIGEGAVSLYLLNRVQIDGGER